MFGAGARVASVEKQQMFGWFGEKRNKPDKTYEMRSAWSSGRTKGPQGFSEEALRGLADLDARIPPPGAEARPASAPGFKQTARLAPKDTAGGGLVANANGEKVPHYWGHRARLRARFLSGGHAPMPEYEILELLLFNAIERIDVKPLAKRLLAAFGDLNGVIAASEHRVLKVDGATPKVYYQLRLAQAFAQRMGQAKVLRRDVMSSWDELITYCRTAMAHRDTEQFRILFLDKKNIVIADEEQAKGTVDHVPVYPREVAKRALELSASAIILVHNHPSGNTEPSGADISVTKAIVQACDTIEVRVFDHVIIGKQGEYSFAAHGHLKPI